MTVLAVLTPELSCGHGNHSVYIAVSPVCSPLQEPLPPSEQPLRDSALLRGKPRPAGSELLDKAAPARNGSAGADDTARDSLGAAAEAQAQAEAAGFMSTEEGDALEDIAATGDREEDGDRRGPLRSNILLMLRRRRRGNREKKEEEELPPMQVSSWGRWQGLNQQSGQVRLLALPVVVGTVIGTRNASLVSGQSFTSHLQQQAGHAAARTTCSSQKEKQPPSCANLWRAAVISTGPQRRGDSCLLAAEAAGGAAPGNQPSLHVCKVWGPVVHHWCILGGL